jgi:hypothetical protein
MKVAVMVYMPGVGVDSNIAYKNLGAVGFDLPSRIKVGAATATWPGGPWPAARRRRR